MTVIVFACISVSQLLNKMEDVCNLLIVLFLWFIIFTGGLKNTFQLLIITDFMLQAWRVDTLG